MENSIDHKEEIKEIKFLDKPIVRFVIFLVIPGLIWAYYVYYVPRQQCEKSVQFYPEVKSVDSDNVWAAKQGMSEYYSYSGSYKKF